MTGTKYIEKLPQAEAISYFIFEDIVNVNFNQSNSETSQSETETNSGLATNPILNKIFPPYIFLNKLIPLPDKSDAQMAKSNITTTLKKTITHHLIDQRALKKRKEDDRSIDVILIGPKKIVWILLMTFNLKDQ